MEELDDVQLKRSTDSLPVVDVCAPDPAGNGCGARGSALSRSPPLPLQLPYPLPRPAIHLQHQVQIRRPAPILTVLVTSPFDMKPS